MGAHGGRGPLYLIRAIAWLYTQSVGFMSPSNFILKKKRNCRALHNQANLKKVMSEFHQHTDSATRRINTLDHCYMPFKNSYRAESLPPFRKSDYAAI